FQNWNLPNSNYNTNCIQHDNESSVHELKETFNNPCLLSSTCAGVDNGGTHNNSDYNDDDDLFSASGLLSLSNQESCDLDQQIVEGSNTEELLTYHHSKTFDVPTIASTSVSELTTTTTADTLTILTNNTTFEESNVIVYLSLTYVSVLYYYYYYYCMCVVSHHFVALPILPTLFIEILIFFSCLFVHFST
ncbi:unnamed protein product, partial [Schistosoma mattheei]